MSRSKDSADFEGRRGGASEALRRFVARSQELAGSSWRRLAAGRRRQLWELTGPGHLPLVVKVCPSARGFAQEREARVWLGNQGTLAGAEVPRLLDDDGALRALLMTRVQGRAPGEGELAEPIFEAAGRFLAALHGHGLIDPDPLPLSEALPARHASWLRACSLTPSQRELAEGLAPRAEDFVGVARVPCHRDFTPDNWLWTGSSLAVVDFEHARLDAGLVDLVKLCPIWRERPELCTAFFRGYGRTLDSAERTRLRTLLATHAVATLAWGQRHGDEGLLAEGRRALASARDPELLAAPR